MAGYFNFKNPESSDYYVEMAVDSIDDKARKSKKGIIPQSFSNTMEFVEDYEKGSMYFGNWKMYGLGALFAIL